MPVTPVTVVTGDATITADNGQFRQAGPGPQTLVVLGDGNTLTASGDRSADTLEVEGDLNVLRAGNGADILNAFGEANTLIGGAGDGQQLYAAGNGSLLVGGGGRSQSLTVDGNDSVLIAQGSDSTLLANGNNALLVAGRKGTQSLTVYGNDSALIGGAGANTLTAFGNDNVLVVGGCDVAKIAAASYGCKPSTLRTVDQYRQKAAWLIDRAVDSVPEIEMPEAPTGCGGYSGASSCGGYSVSFLLQWSAFYQSYDFDRCNRAAPEQSLYLEGNDGILIGGGEGNNTITALGNDNLLVAGDRGTQTLTLDGNNGTLIGGGSHGVITVNGNGATVQAGDCGLQEITVNGNGGTLIGGGKHDILVANGNENFLVAGISGVHFLTVNGNDSTLIGGGGINLLTANGDNDVLEAGWGVNTLIGAGVASTYRVDLGDGRTTIVNGLEGNDAANELEFTAGIESDELWFRREGDDLRIDVIGTHQMVTVDDWFAAAHRELAAVRTADGGVLDNHEVDQLVQAMAGFTEDNPGYDGGLSQHMQMPSDGGLQLVLATVWQA